ncbi:class I adenylate-forming enzyme family protein [Halorussus ruber]|uniref:class I adenylate-forming enzyme family protein n=1 Tax=Halorussus ruber TaxID=1126238 RepID=UPI001092C00F|nr:AMP-binding protein [Halorussus ruber]
MTLSLSRRAALWGDRTAVVDVDADRRVSYADLESEADAMARRLSALGVGPGDTVTVVSRNRVETLALLFAVRRLGAIFAPVSHRLTPATVERPLETIDPEVVVHEEAQRDLVRGLPDEQTHSFEDLGRHEGADYESVERSREDSLLYLHTEDGERVVDFPARAVEWNCITAAAAWGLGRDDCAPALFPFSDADGLLRLALPLLYVGGRTALLRAFNPEDALSAVEEEGATLLLGGATEYRELVENEAFADADLGSVEWFGTRSALPADAREELARRAPVVRTYGRVDTGPNNLYVPPDRASKADGDDDFGPDCVGRPVPDCEVRIAGAGDAEPDSEVGELQFRGPVTPRGYLTADGGTDEFSEWVAAGDLAVREDGDYYLVSSAGDSDSSESESARIDPGRVERALEARSGVTAAGVVPASEGVLAAFVGEADPSELREFLGDELPDGAALPELDRAESLPRRSTGELDRAALRRQLSGEEQFGEE